MMKLDYPALSKLIVNSKVLISDNTGPKVLQLANNNCLKFFRLKSYFSSGLYYHYADRFIFNANKLRSLHIPSVRIINSYLIPKDFIKQSKLTKAVEYTYISGHSLRDLIQDNLFTAEHAREFGSFMAKLHKLGVYFRACHFGNILFDDSQLESYKQFALIDIENLVFYNNPLSQKKIARNFSQMTRYQQDKDWLLKYKSEFESGYGSQITL